MSPPRRIGLLMQSLRTGGLEALVMRLARGYKAMGLAPEVIAYEAGELHGRLEADGVPVHCIEKGPGYQPSFTLQLGQLFASQRYDLIHTHHFGPLLYAAPVALWHGIPLVHTVHSNEHLGPESRRHRRMFQAYATACSAITTVSLELSVFLQQELAIARDQVFPLPNGVDSAHFHDGYDGAALRAELGIEPEALVLGTVARLEPEKGHTYLLEAMAQLDPRLQLLLVGDGTQREPLARRAEALGIADRVHFLGNRPDVAALLCAMDIFVLPSLREGLPLALLEAMAAGRPVVATAVGGSPALLEACQGGRLVAPGQPEPLAEAIAGLLSEPASRRAMADRGQAWVRRRYSYEQMLRGYLAIYRDARPARWRTGAARLGGITARAWLRQAPL